MYWVLIAEDEEEIRSGLALFINALPDFQVTGEADNGLAALEFAVREQPDVLVTDIRMPGLDGLQLADQLQDRLCSSLVVIFSGYADFEYARRAVKANVYDYLLKSISEEEMRDFFDQVKQELDRRNDRTYALVNQTRKLKQGLESMQDDFIADLLKGTLNDVLYIREMLEYLEIPIDVERETVVAVMRPVSEDPCFDALTHEQRTRLREGVRSLINQSPDVINQGICMTSRNMETVILLQPDSLSRLALWERIEALRGRAEAWLSSACPGELLAGISHSRPTLGSSAYSYLEAVEAIGFRLAYPGKRCFHITEKDAQARDLLADMPSDYEAAFLDALRNGSEQGCLAVIQNVFVHVRHNLTPKTCSSLRDLAMRLLSLIEKTLNQNDESIRKLPGTDPSDLSPDKIATFCSVQSIQDWITMLAVKAARHLAQRHMQTYDASDAMIDTVRRHIDENIHEHISLQGLADRFHMNPTYFSEWFKKKTGSNYIDYLKSARMELAKRLLRQDSMKVYEIANLVGYEYGKYFINTFKNHTGLSPAEYKKLVILSEGDMHEQGTD